MKRLTFLLLFALALTLSACNFAYAQSRTNRIYRPCPSTAVRASVEVQADGDIDLVPCSGRNVLFNGVIASANGISVSGSSRTNFFPYYSTETNLAKSPFAWSGTDYTFSDTALTAEFSSTLTPATGTGRFRVGDFTTTPTIYFDINQTASTITARVNSTSYLTVGAGTFELRGNVGGTINTPVIQIGDVANSANNTMYELDDSQNRFSFNNGNQTGVFDLADIQNYQLFRTITAGGTTGARTINRPAGTVNFAAAATSLVVTNSIVTTSSIILATARTNDSTCSVKNIVPAAGSFTINMTAGCTAETSVGFLVLN